MNMNKIRSEKKIATLSIVLNITNSCLRKFGMNRTNLRILKSRKVRSTLNPELLCWPSPATLPNDWQSSTALQRSNKG